MLFFGDDLVGHATFVRLESLSHNVLYEAYWIGLQAFFSTTWKSSIAQQFTEESRKSEVLPFAWKQ